MTKPDQKLYQTMMKKQHGTSKRHCLLEQLEATDSNEDEEDEDEIALIASNRERIS